jgi:hypothetical protein
MEAAETQSKNSMQHPVFYLARVTRYLDFLIREYGDYLFVGFFFLCVLLLAWVFTHRRKHPVRDMSVVILPFGPAPKVESEREPVIFLDRDDF